MAGEGSLGLFTRWWRRRESNPRPKALHYWYYMLSFVFSFSFANPDEQEEGQRSSKVLTNRVEASLIAVLPLLPLL